MRLDDVDYFKRLAEDEFEYQKRQIEDFDAQKAASIANYPEDRLDFLIVMKRWKRWLLKVSEAYMDKGQREYDVLKCVLEMEKDIEFGVIPYDHLQTAKRWLLSDIRRTQEVLLRRTLASIEDIRASPLKDVDVEAMYQFFHSRVCTIVTDSMSEDGVVDLEKMEHGIFIQLRSIADSTLDHIQQVVKCNAIGRKLVELVTVALRFGGGAARRRLLKVVNRDSKKNSADVYANRTIYTSVSQINFSQLSDVVVANVKAMCKRFEKGEVQQTLINDTRLRRQWAKEKEQKKKEIAANDGWYIWITDDLVKWYCKNDLMTQNQPSTWLDV